MIARTIKTTLVFLLLTSAGCGVSVDRTTLDCGSDKTTETFTLTVQGEVEWSISCSEAWVTVDPEDGQGEGTHSITVTVDRTGFPPGNYEGTLNISAQPDLPCPDVIVKMTVSSIPPVPPEDTSLPQVMDAISISNTQVLVVFSKQMGSGVQDPIYYKITRSPLCEDGDWHATLGVTGASIGTDQKSVTLTTLSQNGVTYRLVVVGVQDLAGNPLVVPELDYHTTFVGTPPQGMVDSDGDGVSDSDEQYGWAVRTVFYDGTELCRDVNSDPNMVDTDGDGVPDDEEMGNSTDPRSSDTDGDALDDYLELHRYFSNPLYQDTDQDGISDGMEITMFKTSPALADTDGDGLTDYEEVNGGGFNPLEADIPRIILEVVGNPRVALNAETLEESIVTHFEQNLQEKTVQDTKSTRKTTEHSVKIAAEAAASIDPMKKSITINPKITPEYGFKDVAVKENSHSTTQKSLADVQDNYQMKKGNTFKDGTVEVAVSLNNESERSFLLEDISLVAFRATPGSGAFSVISTLKPDSEEGAIPVEGKLLGPGDSFLFTAKNESINHQSLLPLMKNPTSLFFEVGGYSLYQTDLMGEKEESFSALAQNVLERCGLVTIDFGDGRVERHLVATSVNRNTDGSNSGITMRQALQDILQLEYQTEEVQLDDQTIVSRLISIRDRAYCTSQACVDSNVCNYAQESECSTIAKETEGFWVVIASGDDIENTDFDEIMIRNGEEVSMIYLVDCDADGLYNKEEVVFGTDHEEIDNDSDGLCDFQEVKMGWDVTVDEIATYHVYPDPRFPDLDKDILSDYTELLYGTDPSMADTDWDGLDDGFDPYPLISECIVGSYLNLAAWWDGSCFDNDAYDIAGNNDGTMSQPEICTDSHHFWLNPSSDDVNDYIEVPHHQSISPMAGYTIAGTIEWQGTAVGKEWATIFSKGSSDAATYSLSINAEGELKHTLRRKYHVDHEYFIFVVVFWSWMDYPTTYGFDVEELMSEEKIVVGESIHVAATFSDYTMKIYINGRLVNEKETEKDGMTEDWRNQTPDDTCQFGENCYLWRHHKYIDTLREINEPLYLGSSGPDVTDDPPGDPDDPFRGFMSDLQYFPRALNDNEVKRLYNTQICQPES